MGRNPRVTGECDIKNSMVYHPSYYETRWRALRDKAGPMRDVIKRSTSIGIYLPLPPRNASKEACPSYHIKELCNERCGRAGVINHTPHEVTTYSWHG